MYLDISHNRLIKLPIPVLQSLVNLQSLKANENPFEHPYGFFNMFLEPLHYIRNYSYYQKFALLEEFRISFLYIFLHLFIKKNFEGANRFWKRSLCADEGLCN